MNRQVVRGPLSGTSAPRAAVDLLLGRPALSFAHLWSLGADVRPFVERADEINRATGGAAVWCGLDEIARHAYVQRRRPGGGWEALMTTNEACLHNPDPAPRTVTVRRPHGQPGNALEVDGGPGGTGSEVEVVVPPGGTAVVRLLAAGTAAALPGRDGCPIFQP